ncbi:uncharacterized [Tachysurus ichikawai]
MPTSRQTDSFLRNGIVTNRPCEETTDQTETELIAWLSPWSITLFSMDELDCRCAFRGKKEKKDTLGVTVYHLVQQESILSTL